MIDWLRKNLPTVQGRLLSGVGLIVAVVIGLWPEHPREFDPVKGSAILVGALAWLFAEFADVSKPSQHDVDLLERVKEVMNDDALSFLRYQDFHNDFRGHSIDPVHQIDGWHGKRYDFLDRTLQAKWQLVRVKINVLAELYRSSLIGTEHIGILTVRHLGEGRLNQPPQYEDEVRRLNEAAQDLYSEYDGFEEFARRRLDL